MGISWFLKPISPSVTYYLEKQSVTHDIFKWISVWHRYTFLSFHFCYDQKHILQLTSNGSSWFTKLSWWGFLKSFAVCRWISFSSRWPHTWCFDRVKIFHPRFCLWLKMKAVQFNANFAETLKQYYASSYILYLKTLIFPFVINVKV